MNQHPLIEEIRNTQQQAMRSLDVIGAALAQLSQSPNTTMLSPNEINTFLDDHADELGDPSPYFLDWRGRHVPLVVRHDTGVPDYAYHDGTLIPYAEWKAAHQPPQSGPGDPLSLKATDGNFAGQITVR